MSILCVPTFAEVDGSPFHMSIKRNENVTLSILRKPYVALSTLRKCHIAMSILKSDMLHVTKGRRQNSSVASGDFLQRMTNVGCHGFVAQLHPYYMLG